MTIDEAKEWLHKEVPTEILLERIYEEFKLELEAEYQRGRDSILSRTCEGCKYDYCGCSVQDSILQIDNEATFNTFSCNKWEQK